jgi:integrase
MTANIAVAPKAKLPAVRSVSQRPPGFAITDKFLKTARSKLGARREAIQFEAKTGLGVRVSPTNISFIAQVPRKGRKPYRQTLGTYGALTIEQARDALTVLKNKLLIGIDPAEERREAAAREQAKAEKEEVERLTVRVLVDGWSRSHLSRRRPNYAAGAYRRVVQHFASLLDHPAREIDRKKVRLAVERIRDKAGEAAARNSLVSLKSAYRWALRQELIDADPLNGFQLPEKTGDRERVLSLDEARAIFAAAGKLDYPGGAFVKLLLLTGCRRTEIAGLRWDEIKDEADGKVIEIPPLRTKTNVGHRVPVSKAALAVLDQCGRNRIQGSPYVLTSGGWASFKNYARVKAWLDEALDAEIKDWTWHDFRRTTVTHLASKGYDPVAIDKLLGHAPTKLSAVARIYQRFEHADLRREMLEVWGTALTRSGAEVVGIKGRPRRRG